MNFQMIQDVQPIYTIGGHYVRDKSWSFVDSNDHLHNWNMDELRTLDYHEPVYEEIYCEDCECFEDREIEEGYYTCKLCGDKVKPGYRCETGPIMQYGRVDYMIDGERVSKEVFETAVKNCPGCGEKDG